MSLTGIIDNDEVKLEEVIEDALRDDGITKLRIGVGYFFISGLRAILPELSEFIERGGEIDILMGNDVNRETYEDLARIYKDIELAQSRQPTHIIEPQKKKELEVEMIEDWRRQILLSSPTPEKEEFYLLLRQWVENEGLEIRIYPKERFHAKTYIFETEPSRSITRPNIVGVVGSSNLTLSGLRSNTELNATVYTQDAEALKGWYSKRWEESDDFSPMLLNVLDNSWVSYQPEKFPPPYLVYLKAVYELFKDSLQTPEDLIKSLAVYRDLYNFQRWAVLRSIQIANLYGGVMVSDVVGTGKTYVGAALLEHFYHRSKIRGRRGKMLIICPPKLERMWDTVISKYNIHARILSLGMLSKPEYHYELDERHGDASVVLIDESHHFRNRGTNRYENTSRFLPSADQVILLTATPYTKGAEDIYNQVKLFHLEDLTRIPITPPNLKEYIRQVEKGESSLSELLTHIMVRRTRHDLINQYGGKEDGKKYLMMGGEKKFLPERRLATESYSIEGTYGKGLYDRIVDILGNLTYARYSLGLDKYLKREYRSKRRYQDLSTMGNNLRGLMKALLLKRLESSIPAFAGTLGKVLTSYRLFTDLFECGEVAIGKDIDELLREEEDLERIRDEIEAKRRTGEIEEYSIDAFHRDRLLYDLKHDIQKLESINTEIQRITQDLRKNYTKDDKLMNLTRLMKDLFEGDHPHVNQKLRKVIVFSQYADTVEHLKKGLEWLENRTKLGFSVRFQDVTSDTTNVDEIVERFAPKANQVEHKYPREEQIDLLISTDLMGEGLNLQDASAVVNYDIHWNPLKLIQRIGRIDRLHSDYEEVYIFNFLPEKSLEKELGLVQKVSERIREINRVLGTDAKILRETEKPNRSFMKAVYQGKVQAVEEYERKVLMQEDSITGGVNLLLRLKEKEPQLIEEVQQLDGIRSAKSSSSDHDSVFLVCAAGKHRTAYLIQFNDEGAEIVSKDSEELLAKIKCDETERPAAVEKTKFRKRYAQASQIAIRNFEDDIKQRMRLTKPKKSTARDQIESELKGMIDREESPERKKTLIRYQEVVHSANIPQALKDFKDIVDNELEGIKLVQAIEDVNAKYNLEEKLENKEEWQKEFTEPPHILCGLYLKSQQ